MDESRFGGGDGGKPRGSCKDEDWMSRLASALESTKAADIARMFKVDRGTITKLHDKNEGGAPLVFAVSRAVHIAPPRRLLDDDQYHLLDALERFRSEIERRNGAAAAAAATEDLLDAFDEILEQKMTGRRGEAPPPLDEPARESSVGRKKGARKG